MEESLGKYVIRHFSSSKILGKKFFDDFLQLDLTSHLGQISSEKKVKYLQLIMFLAVKEKRSDILRMIFPVVKSTNNVVHDLLCPKEVSPKSKNVLFTKSMLAWAVENDDV